MKVQILKISFNKFFAQIHENKQFSHFFSNFLAKKTYGIFFMQEQKFQNIFEAEIFKIGDIWSKYQNLFFSGIKKEELLSLKNFNNFLRMENLPPINEMYSSIRENRDFGVIRKYENSKSSTNLKAAPTKKGSYLDDEIKMNSSPGPANKANLQKDWSKIKLTSYKYPDRMTYVDEIQRWDKKNNMPSPSQYSLTLPWPKKQDRLLQKSVKSNFLDHSQYQSNMTPGPGSYLIATKIAKKPSDGKLSENHSRQPIQNKTADMNTYDPVPSQYNTFKKYEKVKKNTTNPTKTQPRKPEKQNKHPGPGQYQMVHTWAADKKSTKNSSTYLNKISKAPTPSIYYK